MNKLEIGMKVCVSWENIPYLHDVEIISIPQATGEAWILKDSDDKLHYVQTYCLISQI